MLKIFSDNKHLPYKTSTIKPEKSKADIDQTLSIYGITKVMWVWDLPRNKVELCFELSEVFQDHTVNPLVRMKPPTIWKKHRYEADEIDWRLSMRIFHWYIKNQLAMTYAMQSSPIIAFLPFIAVNETQDIKDVVLPRLEEIKNWQALEHKKPREKTGKIIDAEYVKE